jgi:hypothetical protein
MNKLWIIVGFTVITLSSCITSAQYNNAEDDVYYSPKAGNKKNPVMIPDVDVDEIMKKNPAQYGTPTNRLDDGTTNPRAAEGYPAYRAQQDTLYQQNPELSGYYVDPSLMTSEQEEQARRLRRINGGYNNYNSSYWNSGVGFNSWGSGLSLGLGYSNYYGGYGYGNYGYGYGGYGNSYYSPWGYNSWGCGSGFGIGWNSGYGWGGSSWCNPFYSPYYGYGGFYNNPWYGGGGYYNPYYYGGNNWNNGNSGNNGGDGGTASHPIERPRPSVGSNNPPAQNDGSGNTNPGMTRSTIETTPSAPVQPKTYNPAPGAARLDNINGRPVYTAPAPSRSRPDAGNTYSTPAPSSPQPQRSFGGQSQQNNNQPAPSYSNPSPPMHQPSGGGGGRSVGGGGGGSRSSGGGGGGVQRPR